VFKKKFACSGTAIEHSEYGGDWVPGWPAQEHTQLQVETGQQSGKDCEFEELMDPWSLSESFLQWVKFPFCPLSPVWKPHSLYNVTTTIGGSLLHAINWKEEKKPSHIRIFNAESVKR
jgi:hypothetical protein